MNFWRYSTMTALLALATSVAVSAQDTGGMSGNPRLLEQMTQVFGKASAFSVTMKTEAKDARSGQTMKFDLPMAYLNGQMRTELDFAKLNGAGEQAAATAAQMAAMGMDKMINITLPEKNLVYMIVPGLKGYCEVNPLPGPTTPATTAPKIEIVELGKETVDGHDCTKKQIKQEGAPAGEKVLWWAAADLKDMPVKAEISTADGNAVVLHFTNYNFTPPAAAQFAVPEGFKKYNTIQELMMSGMAAMLPQK